MRGRSPPQRAAEPRVLDSSPNLSLLGGQDQSMGPLKKALAREIPSATQTKLLLCLKASRKGLPKCGLVKKIFEDNKPPFAFKNMDGYLSLDIICSLKLTVFLPLRPWKTVRFSEQIMSADKISTHISAHILALFYNNTMILQVVDENRRVLLLEGPQVGCRVIRG